MFYVFQVFICEVGSGSFEMLTGIEEQLSVVFSILSRLLVVALVVVAIGFVVRVLRDKSYSIRQVNVPSSFLPMGHSGTVVANRIFFRIQRIIERVNAIEHAKGYSTSSTETDVSVDLAGMGMPVKAFVQMIGGAFGLRRAKKIDVDFFVERKMLVMLLHITTHGTERIEAAIVDDDFETPLRTLITEAAEIILKYSNDEVLQTYFGIVEQIGNKQIRLAKYRYELYKNDPRKEVNILAAWAWGLCMLERYGEAEEIIKEGIAHHRKAGRLYVIWGSLLTQTGQFEQALEKFNTALEQLNPKETKTRISNIYSSIGNCYLKLKQLDVAMKHVIKATQVEPNASRPYYNLAVIHLLKNEMDHFFETLEKALEKGFQPDNVMKDPNCATMKEDVRLVALLQKYRD
jgi:tetratricopeptide (TPR) repeat protein